MCVLSEYNAKICSSKQEVVMSDSEGVKVEGGEVAYSIVDHNWNALFASYRYCKNNPMKNTVVKVIRQYCYYIALTRNLQWLMQKNSIRT